MKLNNALHAILISAFLLAACSPQKEHPPKSALDSFVDSLMMEMTLEEKIGQMTLFAGGMSQTGAYLRPEFEKEVKRGRVGALFNIYGESNIRRLQEMALENSRLRIPLLFGLDVIHGFRTIFPVPLAEAASWDMEAIEKSARIAASEASAVGLNWTFAPMCDIARDPRWGRIVEGAGEDPYLASMVTKAKVRGFQGNQPKKNNTIAACVKHFAAYGAAQAGRDYHSVDMSERMLREVYLPPYKAAIDEGALTVMTAFNDLNGIPATANKFLLSDILRNEWGFEGFVVTDYTSILELIPHGVASDTADAAGIALQAGVDMDMQSGYFQASLASLVKQGKISETMIDAAVRRILGVKYELGLFEDPFRYCNPEREKNELMTKENLENAREMARKSMVLLKNENKILPLGKDIKSIALIGPLADSKRDMLGSWVAAGNPENAVTLLEGLNEKFPLTEIHYAKGCEIDGNSKLLFDEALKVASGADIIILALGEAAWMSGEAASRSELGLPGVQEELAKEIKKTGKPVIVVLMNGRPLTISWLDEQIPAILEVWFPGTMGGHAIADILAGDYNPTGKLPVTFPRNVGQVPVYYSEKPTGRPFDKDSRFTSKYLDVSNDPLYVFGFGLSYTEFKYSEIALDKPHFYENEVLSVSVEVTNTGSMSGEEVVQLYLRDPIASVTRPVKELKDFKKIFLEPGQSKVVTFIINTESLSFYRSDMSYGCEKGEFIVFVGGNSRDVKKAVFELK
ncbi:MAG TPA: beta-glucosidase BglX [Bacteroidales bacterium]|nr:beta-glucosidase BglX [Bacteroidales bacterium]HPR56774.1 beta-glucosidase BglX [Bacteroidales bacterium]